MTDDSTAGYRPEEFRASVAVMPDAALQQLLSELGKVREAGDAALAALTEVGIAGSQAGTRDIRKGRNQVTEMLAIITAEINRRKLGSAFRD